MPSLDQQVNQLRRAVETRRSNLSLEELSEAAYALPAIRPFTEWIVGEEIAFILRARDAYPKETLDDALRAGIAGVTVDTDETLRDTAPLTTLPVLHRGLLVDPYQLYEARVAGAHGVILLVEAFPDDDAIAEMQSVATDLDLDVVVQVNGEDELEYALDLLDPDSFLVRNNAEGQHNADFERTFSLLEEVPAGKTVISQGGIRNRDQVSALENAGVDAVVIGRWACDAGLKKTLDQLNGHSRH